MEHRNLPVVVALFVRLTASMTTVVSESVAIRYQSDILFPKRTQKRTPKLQLINDLGKNEG